MFWAYIFIVAGVVILLKNLGFITADVWDVLWPLALIALGLSMLTRRGTHGHIPWCKCDDCEQKK